MNVLILTTHLNKGGITQYVFTIAKGLVHRGHKVFLATSGGELEDEIKKVGVELIALNIRTKSLLSPKIYLATLKLKKIVENEGIDVVHAQTRITQAMASFLSILTGILYVSTCHGFFKPRLGRKMFPCWGDKAIAISPPVKKQLIEVFRVSEDRVKLILHGIDTSEYQLIDESKKRKRQESFGIKANLVLGIVSRLSDVKGIDILIKSMKKVVAKVPNVKLIIAGEGREEVSLKKLVDVEGLKEFISFYDSSCSHKDILSLLDIFVMPSRQEGLGLAVMEAQAMGLPVIASKVGGLPSLIKHKGTGILVSPGDEELLADAIINMASDKESRINIGLNARNFIEKEFPIDKMIDETINVYKKSKGVVL